MLRFSIPSNVSSAFPREFLLGLVGGVIDTAVYVYENRQLNTFVFVRKYPGVDCLGNRFRCLNNAVSVDDSGVIVLDCGQL